MTNSRVLYIRTGSSAWKQVPLTTNSLTIGRAPENDICLKNDPQVSRHHATLHMDDRGVWILDQNASNGVIIGGRRIPANEWEKLPFNETVTMGNTLMRVEDDMDATVVISTPSTQAVGVHTPGVHTPGVHTPGVHTPPPAPQRKRVGWLLLLVGVALMACMCLVGGGVAAWTFWPQWRSSELADSGQPEPTVVDPPVEATAAPPVTFDSLSVPAGGGEVQDEHGASLMVPADALESGQSASLDRAQLSSDMQQEIEQTYQVDSLVYTVALPDGQDGTGRAALSIPAPSPDSRLAVLIADRWLGVLETPAQDGAFHINVRPDLGAAAQAYPDSGADSGLGPNRYLVLTPHTEGAQLPHNPDKLLRVGVRSFRQADPDGNSCISEFWFVNHCWRNPAGSVYVFWEDDVPGNLADQEYLRIIDTIKAVETLMGAYQQQGFTAAAISPSNPAYIIIEAGASEPYYSFKTGNVYIPWDIIGGIGDIQNQCTMAHEFFHWIEDEEYRMGVAALSGPKSWWQETSAENAAFSLNPACIEKNLTQYGIVTTSEDILGFQAAPLLWEGGEQARYIHALQLYLSLCDGGANCALSVADWVQAINDGTYPMTGAALAAYERNAKDLGRFLLGTAPAESRAGAVIPPSVISGFRYGDYLSLRTSTRGIWDYGLTMNQFSETSEQQVQVEAKINQAGVYPLWVSNGTNTPMGGRGGNTGLPGLLEIEAGPAFWLKQDQADPVFYPAGSSLKIGPISDQLGIGAARIVAVAPDSGSTFRANLSLADLSGDWSADVPDMQVTPVNCPGFEEADDDIDLAGPDGILAYLSGLGTYITDKTGPNLIWEGDFPEGFSPASDVTVTPDEIILHYRLEIPKSDSSAHLLPSGLRFTQNSTPSSSPRVSWLMFGVGIPLLGIAFRFRRPRSYLLPLSVVGLLFVGLLGLSGCGLVDLDIWGSIDVTYTFEKLEYVEALAQAADETEESGTIWKLSDGQVLYDFDLTIEVTTEDEEGNIVTESTPCKLTAAGAGVTATIGPEGSVPPPDLDQ